MPYKAFIIHYPTGVVRFEPDVPQEDLLQAVIQCGVIPPNVRVEYVTEVPADVRRQVAKHWAKQISLGEKNK